MFNIEYSMWSNVINDNMIFMYASKHVYPKTSEIDLCLEKDKCLANGHLLILLSS